MSARYKRILTALLLFLCLPGCTRPTRQSVSFTDCFDTVITMTAFCSEEEFSLLSQAAHRELLNCHRLFDIYREYPGTNNLCTVNRLAGQEPVSVDARILELLQFALPLADKTDGKLLVTMGSVLRLWQAAREAVAESPESAVLPSQADLAAAAAHTDPGSVVLDISSGTVYYSDPLLRLDVGAVAKGWAADYVCRRLLELGYSSFLLNAGGNVCAVGSKPDGVPWAVALDDPSGGGAYAEVLQLSDMCAVTSGSYQRYFTIDGFDYHHLIDPSTGFPGNLYRMVTVLHPSSALADALSTALFLLPREAALALASEQGVEARWQCSNGEVFCTDGFVDYLQEK